MSNEQCYSKTVVIGPVSADEFQIARRQAVALFEFMKAAICVVQLKPSSSLKTNSIESRVIRM
jgi:hypothetical protein